MKDCKTIAASILAIALIVAAFWLGRQSALLRSETANASYRASYLLGVLGHLRGGDTDQAATLLEYNLDENIATLAEVKMKPALLRAVFVPSRFANQADTAISRFVAYRSAVATNYTGVPLLVETDEVKYEGYEDVNRSRSRINRLVEETIKRNPTTPSTPTK